MRVKSHMRVLICCVCTVELSHSGLCSCATQVILMLRTLLMHHDQLSCGTHIGVADRANQCCRSTFFRMQYPLSFLHSNLQLNFSIELFHGFHVLDGLPAMEEGGRWALDEMGSRLSLGRMHLSYAHRFDLPLSRCFCSENCILCHTRVILQTPSSS